MCTRHINGRDLTDEEIQKEMIAYGRIRTSAEIHIERSQLEMRRVGRMLLSSEDGRLLLDTLEEMYYKGTMVGATPEDTYFKLGQRDVVVFLLALRDKEK